jgi:hypothetical protein
MSTTRTTLAFFRPTLLVLVALILVVGINRLIFPASQAAASAEIVASSALRPTDLPRLGADRIVFPDPDLSPEKVVETQLAGLADPTPNGLGILQCFCLASPANRAATGPLERFGAMVRQGDFACLSDPQATLVGSPRISGPLARLLVTVVDRDQRLRAFTFILSRQSSEPFRDCWMTEAVYPVTSPLEGSPALPASDAAPAADEIQDLVIAVKRSNPDG